MHGEQEGSAYNGHFETVCYHPLFLFNDHGDCLAAKLRPGNVHSTDDWDELLLPEIERQQAEGQRVAFRGDAAFAKPDLYEALEKRGVQYAIRIPVRQRIVSRVPFAGVDCRRVWTSNRKFRFLSSRNARRDLFAAR